MRYHFKSHINTLFILILELLVIHSGEISPSLATTKEPVFSVVRDSDSSNQWTAIAQQLNTMGVEYCVIPLDAVKTVHDLGRPKVLFLPNVETLNPEQIMAIDGWMKQGGKLIATGAVGSLSIPGVRQVLRTILGGYWGFSLNTTQGLVRGSSHLPNWHMERLMFGNAKGGVLIPDNLTSQIVAVWDYSSHSTAVLTTKNSTFLGWRWGTDVATTAELDHAWLKASLSHHLGLSIPSLTHPGDELPEQAPNCSPVKAAEPKNPLAHTPLTPAKTVKAAKPKNSLAHTPLTPAKTTSSNLREPIDQLEEAVRLDVQPNSDQPISSQDAIALQQELENLIGRVESAHLAASVVAANDDISNNPPQLKTDGGKLVAATVSTKVANFKQTLVRVKAVAQNIPLLFQRKNYALLRQQWLQAKSDLWQQFPLNQRLAPIEIRAVWLDRGTIVKAGNESKLGEIFDRLAQSGINTVFFETVNASYPIYPSRVAPQQNPLIKDWDPLESAVKLAHERGMELHAWVWTFAAANQHHNTILNLPADYPGPVLDAHPDWANYDNAGNMIPVGQTKAFFDASNLELRKYLLDLFSEIVTRYQVDGLQLDYIRYPFQDPRAGKVYGYGKAAREQFQRQNGIDPLDITVDQPDLWRKWTAFRTYQVDSFVAQVSKMLREKRQDLILSVAVFPLPEAERIDKIQQHWEFWARNGDIDMIVPMTYALDTSRFQRLAQPWLNSPYLGSTLLVPGIRLLSLPAIGAFDQLQLIRDSSAVGYSLFATANFNQQLDQLFAHTQGNLPTSQPIPQRHPFDAAAYRYINLQKEWQFVQENGQLQMTEPTYGEFHEQAQALETALNQLVALPSRSSLVLARDALHRFQSKFGTWMRGESQENPHQVKVWQNHLITIERLLHYGERRMSLEP